MKIAILALVVLTSGCAMLPASQARMRARVNAEWRPATALKPLLGFHAAVLAQPHLERDDAARIVAWIAHGVEVLNSPHPDQWEAEARVGWPLVRSLLGPYDGLQVWARLFDELLQ
jgi:hypothetical protein